jgi:hypothetical protein
MLPLFCLAMMTTLLTGGLVAIFKEIDRKTKGGIQGVPFLIKPGRDFWRRHPKCTW